MGTLKGEVGVGWVSVMRVMGWMARVVRAVLKMWFSGVRSD